MQVDRTFAACLTPVVNMDMGYANMLTPAERLKILDLMPATANGRRFVAGAFIEGETGTLHRSIPAKQTPSSSVMGRRSHSSPRRWLLCPMTN